jgi:hypothetical protein
VARQDSPWRYDEDRCYHGIDPDDGPARIFVELSEFGPTERTRTVILRELRPKLDGEEFGWGHVGGGPGRAAMVILTDALGLEPSWHLAGAFNQDHLAMAVDEFWIRRSAVLRWVRGVFADLGATDLPAVLQTLPPVEPHEYQQKPRELFWDRRKPGAQTIGSLLGREDLA